MIVPDDYSTIRFNADDVPDLPELPRPAAIDKKVQQKLETIKLLEEHCKWQPFGDVW